MRVFLLLVVITCHEVSASNLKLTDKNWEQMLKGEWMIKFYAPWCPACRAVESTWNEFAIWASKNLDSLSVGSVDVTAQGELNGRFMVTSLPTIYHVRDGEFRQYSSSRTMTEFKDFIMEQKWRTIQPMSSWLGPDSFTMNGVSKLFRFSMKLKTFHENLRSDYGLPGWATVLLIGLVIVAFGLGLGIGLIFCLDWYMGPEPPEEAPGIEESRENDDDEEDAEETLPEKNVEDDEEETVRKRNVKTSDDS